MCSVADNTDRNMNDQLMYDGYKIHMTISVIEFISRNDINVYLIATQTLGRSQPCDVVLFGYYNKSIVKIINCKGDPEITNALETF